MLLSRRFVKNIVLALYLLLPQDLTAQVYPAEGTSFYTLRSPFSIDKIPHAVSYTFRFVPGEATDEKEFEKMEEMKITGASNTIVAQMPYFDEVYSWRAAAYDAKGKEIYESPIYHFRVLQHIFADSLKFRVRVLKNSYKKDLFFFLDHTGGAYDLDGNLIWLSPQIANNDARLLGTNLDLSPDGTITFILNERAFETTYTGEVLWQSPATMESGQTNKIHHEYVKLRNGNYMMLGSEIEHRDIVIEGSMQRGKSSPVRFGIIEEYNAAGDLVWKWSSSTCFSNEQLIDKVNNSVYMPRPRTHTNAFFFDEKENVIYLGLKDVSRILKISYPDGAVLESIEGLIGREQSLFVEQHSINVRKDGSLLIFSNNISASYSLPNVLINKINMDSAVSSLVIIEPDGMGDHKKILEIECDIDSTAPASSLRGGNVKELEDGNFFVCMGGSNRIFIVSPQGEVLYNALVETWEEGFQEWKPYPQYRAMPVYKRDLDRAMLQVLPK